MMKLRYMVPLLGALALGGCENFLEEEPKDFFSPDNFPASEEDLNIAIGGLMSYYDSGSSQPYFNRGWFFLSEVPSDQTVASATGGTRHDVDAFTLTPENEWLWRVWENVYGVVNAANMLVQRIPEIEGVRQSTLDRYMGAALFHRAHSYFNLVRVWGRVPLITEPVDGFGNNDQITAASTAEVYAQIEQDLVQAAELLPDSWSDGPGKPTKAAAYAMLADVYLNMAGYEDVQGMGQDDKWAKAAAAAKTVMDMNRFRLVEDFGDLWLVRNKNGPEHIFSIQFGGLRSQTMTVQSHPSGLGTESGWNYWYTTSEVMDDFLDADERKDPTFVTEVLVDDEVFRYDDPDGFGDHTPRFSRPTPYLGKWWDPGRESLIENSKRTDANFPIYRYADVLLMYAEAVNEASGPTAAAYDAINQVRARAELPPLSGLTKAQFRDAVRMERYWELAHESKRLFDLKRWGIFYEVLSQDPVAAPGVAPHHLFFPIPQRELLLLPGVEQNPGY